MNFRHVYIATMDGKFSALDILDNGNLKWSIETGPGPLLSSSIHRMEVSYLSIMNQQFNKL